MISGSLRAAAAAIAQPAPAGAVSSGIRSLGEQRNCETSPALARRNTGARLTSFIAARPVHWQRRAKPRIEQNLLPSTLAEELRSG